jgi:hypothetical protein
MGLENVRDKMEYCKYGNVAEYVFCGLYFEKLGVIINPAKVYNKEAGKYMPDLFNIRTSRVVDLKTINAPFFKAKEFYGLDPQYAVSFNEKDYLRYEKKYYYIDIYFWLRFGEATVEEAGNYGVVLQPMNAVYAISFQKLKEILIVAPLHEYKDRKSDEEGNAKRSYVFEANKLFKIA